MNEELDLTIKSIDIYLIKQKILSYLMIMQTANALLLIRCFTKYIIEIENECALLEQINAKPVLSFEVHNLDLTG